MMADPAAALLTVGAGKKLLSDSVYCGFAKDLVFGIAGQAPTCLGLRPTAQCFGSSEAVHRPSHKTVGSTLTTGPVQELQ